MTESQVFQVAGVRAGVRLRAGRATLPGDRHGTLSVVTGASGGFRQRSDTATFV